MAFCKNILHCCTCLYGISLIAGATIGLLYEFLDTFEELDVNGCLQIALDEDAVGVEEPDPIEYDLLTYFSYALAGTIVGACCLVFCKDSSSFALCTCCFGCGILIAAMGVVEMLSHIFSYIYAANKVFEDNSIYGAGCMTDGWKEMYTWSFVGGCIAVSMISSCCCVCCAAMFSKNDDDSGNSKSYDNTYGGNTNTGYSGVSSPQSAPSYAGSTYGGSARAPSPAPSTQRAMVVARSDYGGSNQGGDVELTGGQREVLARILLSAAAIEQCGFSLGSDINKALLLGLLKRGRPNGQTAMRDAIVVGVARMIKLKVALAKLGVVGHQFIHIVLTDGADNASNTALDDLRGIYYEIGKAIGDKLFKTFFIGIGLGYTEKQQLQSVADFAGDAAELYNCSDVQLSDVFDRIKLSLGIERRMAFATDGTNFVAAKQDRLFLQAEKQKFLVLFSLDYSGSMDGGRWNKLLGALAGFFQGLEDTDIIGVELFNHQLELLTGEDLNNATS